MTTDNEKKRRKLVLTCFEASEPEDPGFRELAKFEDDAGGILNRSALSMAVYYVNDLLAAVTDNSFDLESKLSKLCADIMSTVGERTGKELGRIMPYELPLSIVNLVIAEYNLKLEER